MSAEARRILIPILIALTAALVLLIARGAALKLFRRWTAKTETRLDDIVVAAIMTPSVYWCLAIGLYLGIALSDLPDKYILHFSRMIKIIVILSITVAAANLAGALLSDYIRRSNLPIPATGLAHGIIKGLILAVGFVIILSVMGISIAPIVTALGVGGLAVALALQDTLANLFAGIYILIEKPLRVGDFVRLETGQEGYVEDITWRTTRIRMLPNNMVIVPNNKITQSVLTNYHLPEKRTALLIPVSVSYASNPEAIERVLVDEAARAVGEVPGLLGDPPPFVRFEPGFGDSSLDFTLVCQVAEVTLQHDVQHALRKRILRRFREEGIEIPFPHRTVLLVEGERKESRGSAAPV